MNRNTDESLPVVCTLNPGELAERSEELLPGLAALAREVHDLADGYSFQFSADPEVIQRILATIQSERACCQFLTFRLIFKPAMGPLLLEVMGPEGTKELLGPLISRLSDLIKDG